ncbi:MAG: DNA polymerase III subunit alpha [Candidatus Saccharibacteria bacterium]
MASTTPALTAADYVHLHNHTQYSLLDGLTKVPALVEHIKASGMPAVAVTDHGTLSGIIEFYKVAHAQGVKPILGMEAYVAPRARTDRDPSKDKAYYHLVILAMNNQGYQNLMRLSSMANLEGFYYKPRIDHEILAQYNEGLIILSGCIGGEIGDSLRNEQYDQAKATATWYKKIFGDRYYLEVQDHGHPDHPSKWDEQVAVTKLTLQLARELDIPCVVTCDAHYLEHKDQIAHEILLCVQTGAFLSDEKRMSLSQFELHVTDPAEIIARWGTDYPDMITNTRDIASRCDVTIELGRILIPKFPVPQGENEKTYLDKLVYRGLAWRYGNLSEAAANELSIEQAKTHLPANVATRTTYELGIIDQMGFNGYFLIVSDFIGWGKNEGIVFGPGRGSAAGSIIAYALKITELDPLKYDLLFERFLNPDRISMPDVDIDIQDTRRNEVIQYCVQKYGTERVANIATFGRMAARNAVRDVARVLQVPYADADRLAKMIPQPVQGHHIPLANSLQDDHDLKREYETNEISKKVFDLALQLEGTIRSHGIHAAGVVIAPDDIVKFVPLEMAQKGVVATQFPMGPIEELGLLKMDFLGLSNLTIIKNALRIIKRVYDTDIDINTIPLDDAATYALFQRGDTTGVFQLESAGMKRYLRDLKPTTFEDIVAMVALYRPGPMQFIDEFIGRKHGEKRIIYPHPSMENSLKNTYGVLVYQEQVMQISKEVCGLTGGEADTLRKAISKKKIDIMRKMKVRMIEGAKRVSGIEPDVMEKFWKQLEDFAAYCFNKSHAACYGLISYQTAYLKAHYPAAYMAALMTSDYDDTDRLAIEITECKHMGITVLPPDVNESYLEFAVVPESNQIRFGMLAIKNVGSGAVEEILRARAASQFSSLEDFLTRVNYRVVNRKAMESLIKSGAFDRYTDRSTLLHNLDTVMAFANRVQKQASSGQTDLFGNSTDLSAERPKLELPPPAAATDIHEQLVWERELLGLYLSQHPLELFETFLSEQTVPLSSLKPPHDGKAVTVGGAIVDVREILTKKGQKMAFVKIEDRSGEMEAILFPNAYQQTLGLWQRDRIVLIRGKVNARDREGKQSSDVKIMIDDAREVTSQQAASYQATGHKPRELKATAKSKKIPMVGPGAKAVVEQSVRDRLFIRVADSRDQTLLLTLKQTLDAFEGSTEVVLVLGSADKRQAIKLPNGFDRDSAGLAQLQQLVGDANVKIH